MNVYYKFLIAYICQNDRVMTDIEYATSQEKAIKYFRLRDKTSKILAITVIEKGVEI